MKTRTCTIGAAALALTLSAACSSMKVHTDRDPSADFSKYRTYEWAPSGQMAADVSGIPSGLMESRIRASVDRQLSAKGLQMAEPGVMPDLYVSNRLTQREKVSSSGSSVGVGVGFGGGGGFGTVGGSTGGGVKQHTEATLVLDLFDVKSGKLVWRGIASDTVDQEKSEQKIEQAVTETLNKYPS